MIDISMLKISPKLISVELNRVGTQGGTKNIVREDLKDDYDWGLQNWINGTRVDVIDGNCGRFPTQLFTNIKNDRYKYVKNIS